MYGADSRDNPNIDRWMPTAQRLHRIDERAVEHCIALGKEHTHGIRLEYLRNRIRAGVPAILKHLPCSTICWIDELNDPLVSIDVWSGDGSSETALTGARSGNEDYSRFSNQAGAFDSEQLWIARPNANAMERRSAAHSSAP